MDKRLDHSGVNSELLIETLENPYREIVESTSLVNLRKEQRLETQFSAEAISQQGVRQLVVVTDISRSGLRVAAFWQVIRALMPDPTDPSPILLQLNFSMPTSTDNLAVITVQGSPVYTRFVNEDNYQIGMRIISFVEGEQAYAGFLKDHGMPC